MESSCVFLQLGQCGTQLGHHLIDALYRDASELVPGYDSAENEKHRSISLGTYFTETIKGHQARAVTIDMEPKVVSWARDLAKRNCGWEYPKGMQLCEKSGSGNNWSFGFQVYGPKCEDDILDLLCKESEKCDQLSGFIIIMSLAGGTGSGLGSYVTQLLNDHFPRSVTLNPVVMPYQAGEVSVQNYNAMLTLACTLSNVNGSIVLHNDNLHRICHQSLFIKNVSITDLNLIGAHHLASVLQPAVCHETGGGQCSGSILSDTIRLTSCHSQYKLLTLRCLPHVAARSVAFSTFSWSGLLRSMHQMHLTNFFIDEGMDWKAGSSLENRPLNKSIANVLYLRGDGVRGLKDVDLKDFLDHQLYTSWIPSGNRCHIWRTPRPFQKYEKSVSMLSNSRMCVTGFDCMMKKAWNMFGAKAYLHQYLKYGLEEEDFLNSFLNVESIIKSYNNL